VCFAINNQLGVKLLLGTVISEWLNLFLKWWVALIFYEITTFHIPFCPRYVIICKIYHFQILPFIF
jgi:hypothetical protein